jgi:hypothetical protein
MASERKRPFYLVLALVGALALGTIGSCNGWAGWMRYQESVDVTLVGQGISDPADRAAVESRAEAYVRTLDAAKSRGWPVAVATLLLGSAVVLFAMRGLGGSPGARAALVQVVVAQAGLSIASSWLLRDVAAAFTRLREAADVADVHEHYPRGAATDDLLRMKLAMDRAEDPIRLVLSTIGSVLVVVALTRRRARDFFDAAGPAVEER